MAEQQEQSAFDMPEENTEDNKEMSDAPNTNDIMKDPFSNDIINNEYGFS